MKNDDKLENIKESLLSVMREPRRWLLLVGTGASVEMDPDLGMPALAKHLLTTIPENTDGWQPIVNRLKQRDDLETALTGINLTETLYNEIAKNTSAFVAQKDMALRDDVLTGKKIWVGELLLQQLMRGLSPTWPRLPIITPNYDLLIEYACSKANIPFITGYHGGIIRQQDWRKARKRLYRLTTVTIGGKRRDTVTPIPCVELMKVHGSINLFRSIEDGNFVENNIWTSGCPQDYMPVIAPPGDIKIGEVLNSHDRLFGEALQTIDKATAFFVIGYGFRDNHIHQKIQERIRIHNCPLLVLTLNPSTELDELPTKGENVWVITGIRNKTNGKTDPSGTRFVYDNGKRIKDINGVTLWKSDVFAKQILGG